ncbi:unnamed protein product [Clonostachys rhizophaga]|uniref:Uncharacterized protein n=1 Tax=Clonostachys rhizophaga TaxID=160324 RepID=A0A9N9VFV0_9HYPO|nr:unnamed protein product [Clonostachys rhizophaga]
MSSTTSPSMTITQALTAPFVAPSGCADNFVPANSSRQSLILGLRLANRLDGTEEMTAGALLSAQLFVPVPGRRIVLGRIILRRLGMGIIQQSVVLGIYQFPCARTLVNNITTVTRSSTITQGYVNNTAIKSVSVYTTTTGTTTLGIHNAWLISWDPSDASTLSPSPPMLKCTESVVDMWVPGETTVVPGKALDKCGPGESSRFGGLTGFLVIGLPLICVFLLVSCCSFLCLRRRKHKERRHVMRAMETDRASVTRITKKDKDQSTSPQATRQNISVQNVGDK